MRQILNGIIFFLIIMLVYLGITIPAILAPFLIMGGIICGNPVMAVTGYVLLVILVSRKNSGE